MMDASRVATLESTFYAPILDRTVLDNTNEKSSKFSALESFSRYITADVNSLNDDFMNYSCRR